MTKSVRYIDKDDRKEEGFEEGMMFKRYILRDLHILFPLGSRLWIKAEDSFFEDRLKTGRNQLKNNNNNNNDNNNNNNNNKKNGQ